MNMTHGTRINVMTVRRLHKKAWGAIRDAKAGRSLTDLSNGKEKWKDGRLWQKGS